MRSYEQKTCLSLSTLYYSLFGGDSMLESLVNLSLDTSLSLLFLCTVSTDDPLGLSEVGSDGLWLSQTLGLYKLRALRQTNLNREGFQGSSFNRIDRELVIGVNGSETSRNLVRKHQTSSE